MKIKKNLFWLSRSVLSPSDCQRMRRTMDAIKLQQRVRQGTRINYSAVAVGRLKNERTNGRTNGRTDEETDRRTDAFPCPAANDIIIINVSLV